MSKLEITENFARRVELAAQEFGGRRLEREAELAAGTVSRIMSGKQRYIGEDIFARLDAAIKQLDTGVIPPEVARECVGGRGTQADHVIDDAEETLDRAYRLGLLRGEINAALKMLRANSGWDDYTLRSVAIVDLAVDGLAKIILEEGDTCLPY